MFTKANVEASIRYTARLLGLEHNLIVTAGMKIQPGKRRELPIESVFKRLKASKVL